MRLPHYVTGGATNIVSHGQRHPDAGQACRGSHKCLPYAGLEPSTTRLSASTFDKIEEEDSINI